MAAKEGTTLKQVEVSHHYNTAKAAIRYATKEPPITHPRLRRTYSDRGEKANHKLESLKLSRKDQDSISRLRNGHHPDQICWLHNMSMALDTVCRKCGMWEETVEHPTGECPRIRHQTTLLPETYLIALELCELWKVRLDLPIISHPG